jgi:hypothetical protein
MGNGVDRGQCVLRFRVQPRDESWTAVVTDFLGERFSFRLSIPAPLGHEHRITRRQQKARDERNRPFRPLFSHSRSVVVDDERERARFLGLVQIRFEPQAVAGVKERFVRRIRRRWCLLRKRERDEATRGNHGDEDAQTTRGGHGRQHNAIPWLSFRIPLSRFVG